MAEKRDSFLKGALILTAAGFLVKILGAVYRIPLALMIKDEGMGLYQMAYPIYITLLAISTAGLPTAISKMVAEDVAIGRLRNAYRIFLVSLGVLAFVGVALTVVLMSGARVLAVKLLQNPKAYYPIMSIAPAIFFVSIMSSFRGFFQGLQDMIPSAISQIVEQIGRVIAVFVLAGLLLPYGVEYAAAGAAFGPVAGAVAGLLILIVMYFRRRRDFLHKMRGDRGEFIESPLHIIYRLFAFAIPITLGGLIAPIMNLADAAIVSRRLQYAGFTVKRAAELYGQLTGMAGPLINLPVVVTTALSATLVPAISEAMALKNERLVAQRADTGMRVSMIFSLPAAVGMYILAEPIMMLLYKNPESGVSLQMLSWGVVFLALTQTTTGILQGIGHTLIPVKNIIVGAVAKILINYYLTSIPSINIKGAALGTVIGFFIPAVLNFMAVARWTGVIIDVKQMILKPVLASFIMGVTVSFSYGELLGLGLGQNKVTLVAIAIGGIMYAISLLLIGGLKRSDLELLPGGSKLAIILDKLGIFRR